MGKNELDALRYRWLREHFFQCIFHTDYTEGRTSLKAVDLIDCPHYADEDSIDAAVDAVMEKANG